MDAREKRSGHGVGASPLPKENERTGMGAHKRKDTAMHDTIEDAMPIAIFFFMLLWGWRPVCWVIGRLMGWA